MLTDTIKLIEPAQPPQWTNDRGQVFNKWLVTFQTGKEYLFKSTVDAQKNPTGSFKKAVGDTVTYEVKTSQTATHGRMVTNATKKMDPKPFNPTVFSSKSSDQQKDIRSSVAVNNAIKLMEAEIKTGKPKNLDVLAEDSKFIYNLLEELRNI